MESIGVLARSVDNIDIDDRLHSSDVPDNFDTTVSPCAIDEDDDDDLPLVHCEPFNHVREPLESIDTVPRQPTTTDFDIKVLVASDLAEPDLQDLMARSHPVPAFDDITCEDVPDRRFPKCFVIPTDNNLFKQTMPDDLFDNRQELSGPVNFSSPFFPERTPNKPPHNANRRLRRRVTASEFTCSMPEKTSGEVVHSRKSDDDSNVNREDNDDELTAEFSRRQFHDGGRFLRYRYPIKFHRSSSNADLSAAQRQEMLRTPSGMSSEKSKKPLTSSLAEFLPASLRTTTRYGKEPQLQSMPSASRGTGTGNDGSSWRPRRPRGTGNSKRRRKEVAKRDAESQCSPEPPPPSPPPPVVTNVATQTIRKKMVDNEALTDVKVMCDAAVQVKVETKNRMVETLATLVDFPLIDYSSARSSKRHN